MKTPSLFFLIFTLAVCGCGKRSGQHSGEATMFELNQALSIMSMGGKHPPANVNDLTNFPSLHGKSLPKPPVGQKLVIDPSQGRVVFVDQ
jgi:hypothetical protein